VVEKPGYNNANKLNITHHTYSRDLAAIVIHGIPKRNVPSNGITATLLNFRIFPAANYQIQLSWNILTKKSKDD
jgi:hypothetical protein